MKEAKKASFWEHLEELRRRIFIMLVVLVLTTVVAFAFSEPIMRLATSPAGGTLLALSPAEAVTASLKMSLLAGVIASTPVVFIQIWAFIAPGLYRNEKRGFLTVVLSCLLLFAAGAAFGWFVMLEPTLMLFRSFETGAIHGSWSISGYTSFLGTFILLFGVAFQLPLAIMILTRTWDRFAQDPGKVQEARHRGDTDHRRDPHAARPGHPDHPCRSPLHSV